MAKNNQERTIDALNNAANAYPKGQAKLRINREEGEGDYQLEVPYFNYSSFKVLEGEMNGVKCLLSFLPESETRIILRVILL